jgi:lytic murein transglycosylase
VILRFSALLLAVLVLAACQSAKSRVAASPEESAPSAGTAASRPTFAAWKAELKEDALSAGVSTATFERAFQGVAPNAEILAKDDVQPEYTRPIWAYLDTAVSPENIAEGRAQLAQNGVLLKRLAQRYGVEPQVIVAIWGLESGYGKNTGGYNVIEALATLAYASRRPEVFRQNLIDALLILEAGDIAAGDMQGSWAGAMGQTQFMPAAFRRLAVDADGDGRRDIWRSLPDVFASTANYLVDYGWRPGEPWGLEVRLPKDFPWEQAELDVTKSVAEWSAMGVRRVDGKPLPQAPSPASIIAPTGHRGPAFIVFENFRTFLDYNNSISYALAVGHLADRIAGRAEFTAAWPRAEPALSRTEKLDLQQLLLARGYDPGAQDGVIGPKTRAAIRLFQREIGEVPDGFATMALLTKLRAVTAS